MPERPIIIKKYENRRLYDTHNSRYVNLEESAQMVRDGTEVQVIDAGTGDDLTRVILTQIITEGAKSSDSAFPLDMLRQMVKASGRVGQEGLAGYMKAMADMYQNTYAAFVPGYPVPGFAVPRTEPPAPGSPRGEEGGSSIEELRRRIEELEQLMARNAKARPAATKKRTATRKR